MISYAYIKSKVFKKIEQLRNHHMTTRSAFSFYPQHFWTWCGIEHLYLQPKAERYRAKLIKKYTKLTGELDKITIHSDSSFSYDDHVTRINTKQGKLDTAVFTKPNLSAQQFVQVDIAAPKVIPAKLAAIIKENPYLADTPTPFDYQEMERGKSLQAPVCVGLPEHYADNFIFNQHHELKENVLHLPIKITKAQAHSLAEEGRVLADKASPISHDAIYLPAELSYLKDFVAYIADIEMACNPFFLDDYYIFLSISHSTVPTGKMQRRGGWHIDGHQGYERVQFNGNKLPCDRQYTMSNALPTQTILQQFNFDKLRAFCKKNLCTLDSINMQDVVEQLASAHEEQHPDSVLSLPKNRLMFLNPYMVHRAVPNLDAPVKRTFIRILCSTYTRNRLGDSVNPVMGPLYPLKIKTITDIHEVERRILLN